MVSRLVRNTLFSNTFNPEVSHEKIVISGAHEIITKFTNISVKQNCNTDWNSSFSMVSIFTRVHEVSGGMCKSRPRRGCNNVRSGSRLGRLQRGCTTASGVSCTHFYYIHRIPLLLLRLHWIILCIRRSKWIFSFAPEFANNAPQDYSWRAGDFSFLSRRKSGVFFFYPKKIKSITDNGRGSRCKFYKSLSALAPSSTPL